MRLAGVVFSFVVILAFSASAALVRIGTLPTPHATLSLSGLDVVGDDLFAVADLVDSSMMYIIDAETGVLIDEIPVTENNYLCSGEPRRFISCATQPGESPRYWVGDRCGILILYYWEEGCLDTIRSLNPMGSPTPHGLFFDDGVLYMLDSEMSRILVVERTSGEITETIYIEQLVPVPHALAQHNGDYYVVGGGTDVLYRLDNYGYVTEYFNLQGIDGMSVRGLTFMGDTIYVAVPDSEIYIYSLDNHGEDVVEGDSVVVEVIPDEVTVAFDSVATAGSLYVEVLEEQACPPPEGVTFFSDFYEMASSASFDYIAQVTLMTDSGLPPGADLEDVRVFVRPSGECRTWRDITVAPVEEVDVPSANLFRTLMRTQSEEDEFSVFALGIDERNPGVVARLKFDYLEDALTSHEGDIPPETYEELTSLLTAAHAALSAKRIPRAIHLVERFAAVVEETPEIPHRYDPEGVTENVAGQLLSRSHTLLFTLDLLIESKMVAQGMPGKGDSPTLPNVQSSLGLTIVGNPSVRGTSIRLIGCSGEPVTVSVYSIEGKLVRTLVDGQLISGPYTVSWDGHDGVGRRVAPGTYFVVARQASSVNVTKIVLSR